LLSLYRKVFKNIDIKYSSSTLFFYFLLFQMLKPSLTPPPQSAEKDPLPFAVARPHANPNNISSAGAFQRQGSFRGFNQLQAEQVSEKEQKRATNSKIEHLPFVMT
jgi:hypothetical protein